MLGYLHRLSGFFFYLLCASFFLAYVFIKNDIWATSSAIWMQVADLPLILCAILYGGMSFYKSLKPSFVLFVMTVSVMSLLFIVALFMNFWPS